MAQHGKIATSVHPEYLALADQWSKWRYIMEGGDDFIERYVEKFSDAESDADFEKRKRITPVAGFAKSAIIDIQNAIFQRMSSIRRQGGTQTWQDAIRGQLGGVDLGGSNMNHFIGTEVLPELLSMGKVGIYVDNFEVNQRRTLAQRKKQHPYLYTFVAEDIRNWEFFTKGNEVKLKQVLLRVRTETPDPDVSLVNELADGYRHYWIVEEDEESDFIPGVWCVEYDIEGHFVTGKTLVEAAFLLGTDEIPFHILELRSSLLTDIANHQITLTNMESADAGYVLRSNLPVYTEQFDQKFEHSFNQGFSDEDNNADGEGGNPKQRKIGDSDGIRYPIGAERPGFVHPSSEPVNASMAKQKALKDDIRQLVNLALSNTKSRFASAESKELDERGLEAGLSAVGLVLEHAEKRVAEIWAVYEESTVEITIHYPERYSLRTDAERRADAEQLSKSASAVGSTTFRQQLQIEIAVILLGGKVADSDLDKIINEIETTDFPTGDPDQIRSDVEAGLVSKATASLARGWPEGEAEKAKEERAEMEAERAKTQGINNLSARGLDDDALAAKEEKTNSQNPESNLDGKKLVRGKGRQTKE